MSRSRVHLFGNWKWTGPAELVLESVEALREDSELLLGPCPYPDLEHAVRVRAIAQGLEHRVLRHLRKHFNPLRAPFAVRELQRVLVEGGPLEVLHAHFDGDHRVAAAARRDLVPRPALVRSVHDRPPHGSARRRLLRRDTELLLAPTVALARELETDLGAPRRSVGVLTPGVDQERFHPRDAGWRQRGRERLGLPPNAFVLGIVARVQPHRRFDLLIDAWTRLAEQPDPPHLVVLGRGTHIESLLREPARARGLETLVHSPGYLEGDAYLEALCACDAGLYLVPGTDVTCRAVREWMAMGRGVAATMRPPLPEIVRHGVDGMLFEERPEALVQVLADPDRRTSWREFGERAAEHARQRFTRNRVREELRLYDDLAVLACPGRAQTHRRPAEALAIVRPGSVAAAAQWASDRGVARSELLVADPAGFRDVGIDTLALLNASGAGHVLLAPFEEWDHAVVAEIQRARKLDTSLLLESGEAPPSGDLAWMARAIEQHFVSPLP